ncbi:phosphate ABC transporter substrate-binding protein, partial [Blautia wexlerae]|nr:phosphate ABC transporter substrate-binding protein [Blautia wexlerae]
SDKESDAAKDFVNYMMSSDGQKIVDDNGYIKEAAAAKAYEAADGVSGKVVVAGSSSVTPVMEKLAERYEAVNKDV